jgi:hypothetical protein
MARVARGTLSKTAATRDRDKHLSETLHSNSLVMERVANPSRPIVASRIRGRGGASRKPAEDHYHSTHFSWGGC